MTDPNKAQNSTQIRIGGKTYSGIEDMPPEMRQKFEHMVKQMRDSGMLEDKNRDGIPDRFETMLRILGWIGKLTGNPQLKERLLQQLKAFGASAGTTPPTPTSPRASSPPAQTRASTRTDEPARIRTTSTSGRPSPPPVAATQQRSGVPARSMPRNPQPSAVQRDDRGSREDTGMGEFLRKLAIVSAVVIAGYAALRLLGVA